MGRQRRVEKKKKIKTLGTERCENIKILYTNKIIIIVVFVVVNFICDVENRI